MLDSYVGDGVLDLKRLEEELFDESFSRALLGLFERFRETNDEHGIGQKGRVPCG